MDTLLPMTSTGYLTAWQLGDGVKGGARVILLVCGAPGSCARAAGTRVMGVWEAAHQLRAHSRRAQALACPGENAYEVPAGKGDDASW